MPRPERLLELRKARESLKVPERKFSLSEEDRKTLRAFGRRQLKRETVLSWLNDENKLKKIIVTRILLSMGPKELSKLFDKSDLIDIFFITKSYSLGQLILQIIFLRQDRQSILEELLRKKRTEQIYVNDFLMTLVKNYLWQGVVPRFTNEHGQSEFELDRPEDVKPEYLILGEKSRSVANVLDYNTKVTKLTSIAKILKKEFGSEFIGVVVVGSLYQGYSTPNSDVDYIILSKNPNVLARFKQLSQTRTYNLKLCPTGIVFNPNAISIYPKVDQNVLFRGLFFGDNRQLLNLQRSAFKTQTKDSWDELREKELEYDLTLEKAFIRSNLGSRERRRILTRFAMNALPDYDRMKKQLGL